MKTLTTILTLLLLPLGTIQTTLRREACDTITCAPPSAAHILVSRASTEPQGTGVLGLIAEGIAAACPGSNIVANPYPALLSPYVESETEGLNNLTQMALSYSSCCPPATSGRMVFLGYSQGAQVTADFLCGRSEFGFPDTDGYAAVVADDVAAVVLMGDPSFVKDLPWDRGDASNESYFPRLNNEGCIPVAEKMISYCDAGDYFCDNGTSADALSIHEAYVWKYGVEVVAYVVAQIGSCGIFGTGVW
ncbi:Acetylxylan esterase 2 [Cytospora mali]|uniref:Acetylxylan esterase 2 n=1 Tax=Cytospora mali TaxID=578113 RepID=A0A194VHQ7_CYTMA|nr:Acetylxylan esterase 2 [Valsa mali]